MLGSAATDFVDEILSKMTPNTTERRQFYARWALEGTDASRPFYYREYSVSEDGAIEAKVCLCKTLTSTSDGDMTGHLSITAYRCCSCSSPHGTRTYQPGAALTRKTQGCTGHGNPSRMYLIILAEQYL